jgi:hypothetical protein
MATWITQTTMKARPEDVLDVLTDPRACGRWAPVDFDVDGLDGPRLVPGTRARVSGRLAGRTVGFDVEVHAADAERVSLQASGPVALDVEYRLRPVPAGSEVEAEVSVRGSGLVGRVLAQATEALLAGGALQSAISRIAHEVEAGELAYA